MLQPVFLMYKNISVFAFSFIRDVYTNSFSNVKVGIFPIIKIVNVHCMELK